MALPSKRILDCRVVTLQRATHEISILHLEPETAGAFRFEAGQYASLKFGDRPARDYSMANRPDEPILEFHIRDTGSGGASGYVASTLRPGENVKLAGPFGAMRLRKDHPGPMLCVAGGSGLAPMKAIVETALATGWRQPIHLYFGVRDARDLYLTGHFDALAGCARNFRFVAAVAHEAPADRRRGTVAEAIAEDLGGMDSVVAYLAGPPTMIEEVRALLLARGLAAADILADPFFTDAEKERLGLPLTDSPLAG